MPLFEVFHLADRSEWVEACAAPPSGWMEVPNSPVEAIDLEAAVRAVGEAGNSYRVREAGSSLDWGDRFDILAAREGITVWRVPPPRLRRTWRPW